MANVDNGARRSNTPHLPLAKATPAAPCVSLDGPRGDALEACAEALDAWLIAGPSPASRALESVVGEALAALSRPMTDTAAEALARSIRGAAEAAILSPREGPRVSTFRHGEPPRVWRAVTAAAAVADDLRTARTFVVAAYETRGFNPRVPLPECYALGDGFLVTCLRCYGAVLWRPDGPGGETCPCLVPGGHVCGAPIVTSITPMDGYHDALLSLTERGFDGEKLARYALEWLGFNPHAFSRSDRTKRSRQRSGKSKM